MPRGVYPRKPRKTTRRRVNAVAKQNRATAKYNNAINREMTTAARALVNVANLRLTGTSSFAAANIISALTQGLGFNRA